uniref:PRONE domain-containing protein n=1 Tax=Cucumis melo TaxID=3656 RepID=A0A9I9D4A1_CUCME
MILVVLLEKIGGKIYANKVVSLLLRISPCHQGFTTDALVNNKHQVFKAAKSINENILHEMPLPTVIREAVRASGKATLSEELYKILTSESGLAENMLNQLNLKSDHEVFKAINHLEAVIFSLKEKYTEQSGNKFLVRTSWSFVKDETTRIDKLKLLTNRAEVLLQLLKSKYPNHP